MKIKKVLLSCLMLAGVLTANAQEQQDKIEYVHNPYWYVQIQGGAQYTLGEVNFGDLLSPNVQVALGRQFTPVVGARLSVNAWQSKAGIDAFGNNAAFNWKWKYVAPSIDVTFNLSNLFCGFNPNRIFNFSVFGGLGANIGFSNPSDDIINYANVAYPTTKANSQNVAYVWDGTKVRMTGRFGAAADFKVSEAVSLGLEVNANTLSDHYNSKKAGNWDWYFNALAGLKINLGKTYSTKVIPAPKPQEKIIEKVIERVIEKPCPQVVEPTRAIEVKEDNKFRRDVFFEINKSQVSQLKASEKAKVKEVADYLKANPNATVEVTGYADKGTGNAKINKSLSQRRAQAVYNALVKTYKIKASRIKVDSKGDTIQPFAVEAENRVAICIAE